MAVLSLKKKVINTNEAQHKRADFLILAASITKWMYQFQAVRRRLPLRIGIRHELWRLLKEANIQCPYHIFQLCIKRHVTRRSYQRNLIKLEGKRYNLDGTEAKKIPKTKGNGDLHIDSTKECD